MGEFRSYKNESRDTDWGNSNGSLLTLEQLQFGAILRIADAVELMAKRYTDLLDEKGYWEARAKTLRRELGYVRRSNSALRGHLKRAKSGGAR